MAGPTRVLARIPVTVIVKIKGSGGRSGAAPPVALAPAREDEGDGGEMGSLTASPIGC